MTRAETEAGKTASAPSPLAPGAPSPLAAPSPAPVPPGPPLRVRASTPEDDPVRDRLVLAHPHGTFFHLAGWRRAVERAFGHAPRDLVALRGDEIVGVLPLMRCRGPLGRGHLISIPYAVYGGPVAADDAVRRALVDAGRELAVSEGVGRLELRCREDHGLDLAPSDLYATFVQDLPTDPAEVMKRMPKRARAEVRKAIDKGLELGEGAWYLGDVVDLFHESKQHLGSPGLPARWFEALLAEFPEHAHVHLARAGKEVLAATMSFVFRDEFLFYYIGTRADANREYKATNWLCVRLQEWSIARGLARFDLGRSRRDSGSYSFKEHQGFEPRPLPYRYALVRSAGLPTFTPSNPRTKVLRDAWTRMPPPVARALSRVLARYLP